VFESDLLTCWDCWATLGLSQRPLPCQGGGKRQCRRAARRVVHGGLNSPPHVPPNGASDSTGYLQGIGPGHIRPIGVETFSAELDKMAAAEASRRAGQALRNVAQPVGMNRADL
jgi:hypothetical protein